MRATDSTLSEWLQLVRAEYREIPGLNLTRPQVQRLWGLDSLTCDALLAALTGEQFLRCTREGRYVRFEG